MTMNAPLLRLSPEVREALSSAAPVVALETAVLTHGLPRPLNLHVFREMERAVREAGAVPCPVAVIDGCVRLGVTAEDLGALSGETAAAKVCLPDLPLCCARRLSGGTTVATALWAATRAGIAVLATGGIGGVHRGAETTFDVSGDLPALGRFPGCVVASGAKAILDVPKTVEVLETLGVCVLGYRTGELPAFTCRQSGIPIGQRAETPADVARLIEARDLLGLRSAVLVANQPPEEHALTRHELDSALARALEEASQRRIQGKNLTPFLLEAVSRATGGASLRANRALLVANAALAAEIAQELRRGAPPTVGASCGIGSRDYCDNVQR